MNVRPKLPLADQLTVPEFLAFYDSRPKGERWELIEGVAVMNASPIDFHQMVCVNLVTILMAERARLGATWLPLLGVGTIVPASANSLPQPDVFVKERPLTGAPTTDDALVIFEVLSKSNTKADQDWRRKVYASVPNCQYYVTVSLKSPRLVAHDRATGWKSREAKGTATVLELPATGARLALADVYRHTKIG